MSVIVGFSQANSPLVTGGTSVGAAASALGIDGTGEADLFAALVAMLAPGANPPPPPVDSTPKAKGSAILNVEPTSHPLPTAPAPTPPADIPSGDVPPVPTQPEGADPAPVPDFSAPVTPSAATGDLGKTLLKEFGAALRAAQAAVKDGKPLDPEIERKLRDTLDAVAAYFGGLPQPQPPLAPAPTADAATMVKELAADLLPTPATDLPPAAPAPTDGAASADLPENPQAAPSPAPAIAAAGTPVLADTSTTPAPAATTPAAPAAPSGSPVSTPAPAPATMQAKIVPDALTELGTALTDLATQLERQSPELAAALAKLGDRITVGDIPDDVLSQLRLTRTADSTTPELEQLTAALTATPKPEKPAAAAPAPQPQPFAAVTLDVLEPLADETDEPKPIRPQPVEAEPARPEPAKPAPAPAKADASQSPAPIPAASTPAPDASLAFDAATDLPADGPAPELKPTAPNAAAVTRPADPAPPTQAQPAPQPTTPPAPIAATPTPAPQPVDAAAPVARAAHAAYQAPIQQVNLPQVAFEVGRQFEAGNSRFQIRLDPPELGRIDVKLDVDKSGTVSARMTVERPETLDMMQRDQRALHQALQQAGLDANKTNLEFSLRQNPFAQQGGLADGRGGNQPRFGGNGTGGGDPSGAEPACATNLYRGTASAGGVNLFV